MLSPVCFEKRQVVAASRHPVAGQLGVSMSKEKSLMVWVYFWNFMLCVCVRACPVCVGAVGAGLKRV